MKIKFILLIIITLSINSYAQNKCATAALSLRIDSICKENNIINCVVYFNFTSINNGNSIGISAERKISGIFKLDDCFLIVGDFDKHYFDLSKLVDFYLIFKRKKLDEEKLVITFQGI